MRFPLLLSVAAICASGQNRDTLSYYRTFPSAFPVLIDSKLKARLDAAPPLKPYSETPVAELRASANKRLASVPKMNDRVARAENRQIPGPHGPIPIRIYTPEARGPLPVIVYFHGGGWVVGNLDTHDDFCRSLAARSNAIVVAVDYRLAPEHKFPIPADDCFAGLKWVAAHASEIGGDAARLAVAGDSAGGNLSAGVALMARDKGGPKLAAQVLIYPVTNQNFDTASYLQNASGYGLSRADMVFYWKSYLAKPADADNPYASPLRAKDLAGLPRAVMVTAQFDPLRDDGVAYAARLWQAGVQVRLTNYLDMNHGFIRSGADYDSARKALDEITSELRTVLAHSDRR